MISLYIGTQCVDGTDCSEYKKCKYKARYKFHNFKVNLHRFFEYKLHIKLPYLIYIGQKCGRFSGTDKCPYHKSRNYTCFDCKYSRYEESCDIPYNERKEYHSNEWSNYSRCGSFEKADWADDFMEESNK